jgi:hypothetical protein
MSREGVRMRRTVVFISLAIVAMLVAPTVAQAQIGDRSTGQGLWAPAGNGPGQAGSRGNFQVTWEAIGTLIGSSGEGQFDIRNQVDGSGFHARVVCLTFGDDGEAIIGLESTQGQTYEGEAYALDNGRGNGGGAPGADRFFLDDYPGDGDGNANCDDDRDARDPIYGEIFNVEA